MTSSDEIDVELLIAAVRKNDCIWNYKLQEHSNRTIKNRAWAAVCEEVVSDFKNKSVNEKNAIGVEVQSKWKTLRDSFTRYCRNLKKKSGAAASQPKKYTHYDQLLFFKDVTEDRGQNTSNIDFQPQICPPPTVQSTEETVKKRQRKRQSEDDVLIETLRTRRINDKLHKAETQHSPPPDEDKSFLLSILSDFKKIPDDWKLDAKGDIIQVIKNYRVMPTSSMNYRDTSTPLTNYSNTSMPSTSQSSYNNTGYSTSSNSQLQINPVTKSQLECNDSLSSQDSGTNAIITDFFSQ